MDDSGVLSIMVPAFAECLVLVGIHSYLGLHVIKRKVIFVDLALAQIAALGATVGFLFGMDPASHSAFLFSMAFTFVGAAVFALTRLRNDRVPQEAVIGLVYALAAAVAILVIDKSPHGAEHIKGLLTGTILWVKWPTIIYSAVAYTFVGLLHYVFRRQFIRITEDPAGAFAAGMMVRLWDFLFYMTFGFVISFSVRTAGVLLVFVFLVAPAILAVLLTDRWLYQLIIGWGLGTVVTVAALYLSYVADLPSGPTVVASYGVVLVLVSMGIYLVRARERGRASMRLAAGVAAAVIVVAGMWGLGSALGSTSLARDSAHHDTSTIHHHHGGHHHKNDHHHAGGQESKSMQEGDATTRMKHLKKKVRTRAAGWKKSLVQTVLDPDLPLLFKDEALQLLKKEAGGDFGYDSEAEDNRASARKMKAWAQKTGDEQ